MDSEHKLVAVFVIGVAVVFAAMAISAALINSRLNYVDGNCTCEAD